LTEVKGGAAYRCFCKNFCTFARSIPMMDVVMMAVGFAFFALSIAYVYACDQL
jgi:hypothetical protein